MLGQTGEHFSNSDRQRAVLHIHIQCRSHTMPNIRWKIHRSRGTAPARGFM